MGIEKDLSNINKEKNLPLVDLLKIFLTEVVDLENRKVHTDTSLDVGDIQIGAVELKDHDSNDRANITELYGLEVDPTRKAPEEISVETASQTGTDINHTTTITNNWKLEALCFNRVNAEAITIEVFINDGTTDFLIDRKATWIGKNYVLIDGPKLDAASKIHFKTTGITTGAAKLRIVKSKI